MRGFQSIKHPNTGKTLRISLLGIDTFSIISYSASHSIQVAKTSPNSTTQELGQLWRPPFTSVIHPNFAAELNLVNGQILSLKNNQLLPKLAVTAIAGIGREIVMDIGQLQQVLGTSKISEILVVGETNQEHSKTLKAALPEHLRLEKINTGEQAQQLTGSFHLNLLAMACLMFVVCMFVVMNALHLLIMKRWQNLRIARQLGV